MSVPTIVATGPLTSDGLAKELKNVLGSDNLHFYDASSQLLDSETLDSQKLSTAGRYGKGESDYINCPMEKEEYYNFVDALASAERVELHQFEKKKFLKVVCQLKLWQVEAEIRLGLGHSDLLVFKMMTEPDLLLWFS